MVKKETMCEVFRDLFSTFHTIVRESKIEIPSIIRDRVYVEIEGLSADICNPDIKDIPELFDKGQLPKYRSSFGIGKRVPYTEGGIKSIKYSVIKKIMMRTEFRYYRTTDSISLDTPLKDIYLIPPVRKLALKYVGIEDPAIKDLIITFYCMSEDEREIALKGTYGAYLNELIKSCITGIIDSQEYDIENYKRLLCEICEAIGPDARVPRTKVNKLEDYKAVQERISELFDNKE